MERFSIVFIDDEPLTLELLQNRIDWHSLNIDIIGKFTNVLDAIAVIKDSKPDIVISDINMPHLSGIDFGEMLLDILPQTKLVMLTGYENFSYVRKSLQIGVSDYLLKPICAEEIYSSIQKLCQKISEERRKNNTNAILIHYTHEALWQKILLCGVETEETDSISDLQKIPFKNCLLLILEIEDIYTSQKEKFVATRCLMQYMYDYEEALYCQPVSCCPLQVAVIFDESYDLTNNAPLLLSHICKDLSYNVVLTFSERSISIFDLPVCYDHLQKLLYNKFLIGYNQIIRDKQLTIENINNLIENQNIKQFCSSLQAHRFDQAQFLVINYLKEQKAVASCLEDIRRSAIKIIWLLAQTLDSEDNISFYYNLPSIWGKFIKCNTIDTLETSFWETFDTIIAARMNKNDKTISHDIKAIICERYKDYELSLNTIAEALCRNPSYISRIFKKQTGENITHYIIKLRMKEAKRLLSETSLKISEIAEHVGIIDTNYFSICFRKYIGCSPSEYRFKTLCQ